MKAFVASSNVEVEAFHSHRWYSLEGCCVLQAPGLLHNKGNTSPQAGVKAGILLLSPLHRGLANIRKCSSRNLEHIQVNCPHRLVYLHKQCQLKEELLRWLRLWLTKIVPYTLTLLTWDN